MADMPTSIAPADATAEAVEQDTQDSEDVPNLFQHLLPAQDILDSCANFGLLYNKVEKLFLL